MPDPDYVSIDLIVELCARAERLRRAGASRRSPRRCRRPGQARRTPSSPSAASCSASRCERSALEAAIQAVPGVAGVTCIDYRLRDQTLDFLPMGDIVTVGPARSSAATTTPAGRTTARWRWWWGAADDGSSNSGSACPCGDVPRSRKSTCNLSGLPADQLPGRRLHRVPLRAAGSAAGRDRADRLAAGRAAATSPCRWSSGGPTSPTS